MSRLRRPSAASSATRRSLGVSDSTPPASSGRSFSPVASSSSWARRATASAPHGRAASSAARSGSRASARRLARRSAAPYSAQGARVLEPRRARLQDVERLAQQVEPAVAAGEYPERRRAHADGRGRPQARASARSCSATARACVLLAGGREGKRQYASSPGDTGRHSRLADDAGAADHVVERLAAAGPARAGGAPARRRSRPTHQLSASANDRPDVDELRLGGRRLVALDQHLDEQREPRWERGKEAALRAQRARRSGRRFAPAATSPRRNARVGALPARRSRSPTRHGR